MNGGVDRNADPPGVPPATPAGPLVLPTGAGLPDPPPPLVSVATGVTVVGIVRAIGVASALRHSLVRANRALRGL